MHVQAVTHAVGSAAASAFGSLSRLARYFLNTFRRVAARRATDPAFLVARHGQRQRHAIQQ